MSIAATNVMFDYEKEHVLQCQFTKQELYILRVAAIRYANRLANDHTPTAQNRVDQLDDVAHKILELLLKKKVAQ
jgi:hypothetical protein